MNCKKSRLYKLNNKAKIGELLGIHKKYARKAIANPDNFFHISNISKFQIKKTSGSTRNVINPNKYLKNTLTKLNKELNKIELPEWYFSKRKSDVKKNGLYHLGSRYFIVMDIYKFFDNCTFPKVLEFFINRSGMNLNSDVATSMAKLVTIEKSNNKRYIPQGYPTSTIISFLSYYEMFKEIKMYIETLNGKISVYVDDITISFNSKPNINDKEIINNVQSILRNYNHRAKESKTEGSSKGKVTGTYISNYTLRAQYKIHKKLNKDYRKLNFFVNSKITVSNNEELIKIFIKYWKIYNTFSGRLSYVDYIESPKNNSNKYKKNRVHYYNLIENPILYKSFPIKYSLKEFLKTNSKKEQIHYIKYSTNFTDRVIMN